MRNAQLKPGDRVRAVADSAFFKIGAEGQVMVSEPIGKYSSVLIAFDAGRYVVDINGSSNWWATSGEMDLLVQAPKFLHLDDDGREFVMWLRDCIPDKPDMNRITDIPQGEIRVDTQNHRYLIKVTEIEVEAM